MSRVIYVLNWPIYGLTKGSALILAKPELIITTNNKEHTLYLRPIPRWRPRLGLKQFQNQNQIQNWNQTENQNGIKKT